MTRFAVSRSLMPMAWIGAPRWGLHMSRGTTAGNILQLRTCACSLNHWDPKSWMLHPLAVSNISSFTMPSQLESSMSSRLSQRANHQTLRKLTTFPADSADFSSNDFLSLATSTALRDTFLEELHQDPAISSHLGSGGSRLLDGNSTYAETLERDIAAFHHAETGLLCNSGFDANVGLFSCLPQPGDIIIYDEFIHASVHDGMRSSRAGKCMYFLHNDLNSLREMLEALVREDAKVQDGRRNVFIAVEAVYSMDGDIAPLKEIVALKKELFPRANAHLIVDEAHSTGAFGPKGRGLVSQFGLEKEFTIRLHTFGKALACNGAIILCSPVMREYLVNYARPMIYTTFMSYPALAAIRASYRWLMDGKTEPLARNLQVLIQTMHERLLEMQASLRSRAEAEVLVRCPTECPETPIFAVLSSEPKVLAAHCQRNGFVVRGIVPPTVPAGTERIRVCLHAGNTVEQIDGLVETIKTWVLQRIRELDSADYFRARL